MEVTKHKLKMSPAVNSVHPQLDTGGHSYFYLFIYFKVTVAHQQRGSNILEKLNSVPAL